MNQQLNGNYRSNSAQQQSQQQQQNPFYFSPSQYQTHSHPPPQVQPTPQQHFFHSPSLPSSSGSVGAIGIGSNSNLNSSSSSSSNLPSSTDLSSITQSPKTAEERNEAIYSLEKRRDAIKFTIANLQSEKEMARLSGRPFQSEHTLTHLKDTRESLSDQLIELMQSKVSSKRSRSTTNQRGHRAHKPGWTPGSAFGAHQASEAWNRSIPNRHVLLASGLGHRPHELLFPPRKTRAKKARGSNDEDEDNDDEDNEAEQVLGGSTPAETLAANSKALCGRCRVGHGNHKVSGIGRFNDSAEDFRVQEGSFTINPNTYSGSDLDLANQTPCGCVISDVLLQFFIFKQVRLSHDKNNPLYNQASPWFTPEQLQYLKTFLWKFCGVNLDALYQPSQKDRFMTIRNELDRRLSNDNELNHWWEFIGKIDEMSVEEVEFRLKVEEDEKIKKRKIAEETKKAGLPPKGPGRPRKDANQEGRSSTASSTTGKAGASRKGKETER